MDPRSLAKLVIVPVAAFMTFGLLSMAYAMASGMERCPIMRMGTDCPPHAGTDAPFVNHHVGHFESLALSTAAAGLVLFLAVIFLTRIGMPAEGTAVGAVRRHAWPLADGPPSPILDRLAWAALHNRSDLIAPAGAHADLV